MIRALLVLVAGCAQNTGPHLAAATPASAAHGATVTIAGERMCAGDCTRAAGEFMIGAGADLPAVQLPVLAFADTSAQVMIPAAAPTGHVSIILTVDDTSSNALAFEVTP